MRKDNWQKFPLLLSIYIAQQIPMSFFSTVVPVIMRQENISLTTIGLFQAIKFTWIAKFLWAPFVDKTSVDLKHYKRWIIGSELVYAILIYSIAFLDMQMDLRLIVFLMVFAFIASATQDIGTDAFAIRILRPAERSFGNSMQSSGSFIGTIFGSGVLLILYHYFGWSVLIKALALFVLIPLIPLVFYRKEESLDKKVRIKLSDFYKFFLLPGMFKRLLILVFYYSGIIGILAMLKPLLVDLGYNTKEIGFMSGITGPTMAVIASLAAGWIIKSIGRRKSLFIFAFAGLAAALYFWHLSRVNVTDISVYTGIILIWVAYGLSTVVIYTTSMDIVRKGWEGTDFTVQIVITHLSSLVIAILSGKIADELGYEGLYIIEMFLCLCTIGLLFYVYPKKDKLHEHH